MEFQFYDLIFLAVLGTYGKVPLFFLVQLHCFSMHYATVITKQRHLTSSLLINLLKK